MKKLPIWRLDDCLFNKPGEKYYLKYKKQIEKRGFSDEEVWNLYSTISKFILPRIKLLRKWENSTPMSMFPPEWIGNETKYTKKENDKISKEAKEKWGGILDQIILAFELTLENSYETKEINKINLGLALFAKYYRDLWN